MLVFIKFSMMLWSTIAKKKKKVTLVRKSFPSIFKTNKQFSDNQLQHLYIKYKTRALNLLHWIKAKDCLDQHLSEGGQQQMHGRP